MPTVYVSCMLNTQLIFPVSRSSCGPWHGTKARLKNQGRLNFAHLALVNNEVFFWRDPLYCMCCPFNSCIFVSDVTDIETPELHISCQNKQEEAMLFSLQINATVLHAIATLYISQTL